MSKQKLSPWFDEDTNPVNSGVYKTVLLDFAFYGWSLWINNEWMDTCPTKDGAARCKAHGSQHKQWRGIVK